MTHSRAAARLLSSARSVTFIIHKNPDGDAVGAAFALMQVLKVPTKLVCQHEISNVFQEILGPIQAVTELPLGANLLVILDCADINRTGYGSELKSTHKRGGRILVIDHHQRGNLLGIATEYAGDTSYSSTCEIVAEIINDLRLPIAPVTATALLLGLITDTAAFSHPNTTSRTLALASSLVRIGANFEKARLVLRSRKELSTIRFWGHVLSTVTVNHMGLAIARISQQTLLDAGASETDVAGLAKYLCRLEGTRAALVLLETAQGWRGTLRARDKEIHVGQLARILGGRGSKKIAGFLATDEAISGKLEDVI